MRMRSEIGDARRVRRREQHLTHWRESPTKAASVPSAVTLLRSDALAPAEYAAAAIVAQGARLVFLAGACPLDEAGSTVAVGDYGAQASRCVDNLVTALGAASAVMTDVISTRVLVASSRQEDLVKAWRVVRDAFGDHNVPSTLLGVTMLGYPDQLVEIEAVAALMP